jgi:hypothetical protein
MSKDITQHYLDELENWGESIVFYTSSIEKLHEHLNQIIIRNSIVDIAAKVEVHQLLLEKINTKLNQLKVEIHEQESVLMKGGNLLENSEMTNEIDLQQSNLTARVKSCEKEFIDVKYYCNEFLSETLKK